jgi:hypothetical protein
VTPLLHPPLTLTLTLTPPLTLTLTQQCMRAKKTVVNACPLAHITTPHKTSITHTCCATLACPASSAAAPAAKPIMATRPLTRYRGACGRVVRVCVCVKHNIVC